MQPSLHKFVDRAVVVTIQVAFVIFCCPVALCLALSPPKRRICTRHSHPPSSHACILIAPAPPPTYIALPATAGEWDSLLSHLRNDGNRIFHLRPDTGVLASGNIGAAVDGGVYFVGTPRLVAKVPTRMWKVMLGIFKSVRAEIVETFPPAKEKFWRRPKSWPEVEWVRRCAEVMAAAATAWEDTDEDCFEVWSVEAETMVPNVVVSETWDAWFGMGFSVEIVGIRDLRLCC